MPPAVAHPEDLRRLLLGHRLVQAIHVAAVLGVADLLADGPRSVDDLAALTDVHASSLYRVLRLLASEGVFTETAQRHFGLTASAALLRSGVPGSQRAHAIWTGSDPVWRAWGNLLHAVRTGESAFEATLGMPYFAYQAEHPGAAALFHAFMSETTEWEAQAVVAAYDFAGLRTIVDVGGGRGALLMAILRAYPAARGILYDQPAVAAEAAPLLAAAGLADRCAVVGGNFFATVPAGGDAYLLKYILHDWDDDRCQILLGNCRRAVPADGRLLLVEALLPPGDTPSYSKYLDVQMLVMLRGRERTEVEYRALLEAAGFRLSRVLPTSSELAVLEALPA